MPYPRTLLRICQLNTSGAYAKHKWMHMLKHKWMHGYGKMPYPPKLLRKNILKREVREDRR
mgnify:CR=1 FL=1